MRPSSGMPPLTRPTSRPAYPPPYGRQEAKVLLKGIAREIRTRQSLASFKRTVKSIDVACPAGLRNRALLLLGFAGAFRRSELDALSIEDLAFDEGRLVVTRSQSKSNQMEQAEEKAIFYSSDSALCPIRSLQTWLRVLDRTEGPVLVSLRKNNQVMSRRMTTKYTNLIVQQLLVP